jgi:hypothetical protein
MQASELDHERVRVARSLVGVRDWNQLVDVAAEWIRIHDDKLAWQSLARALENVTPARRASLNSRLGSTFGRDVNPYGVLDLALCAYRTAWGRSEKTDAFSQKRMTELRSVLGYCYEDHCWSCREYLSDAPFDNAGRCPRARFECSACRACGAHRCQAPYSRN